MRPVPGSPRSRRLGLARLSPFALGLLAACGIAAVGAGQYLGGASAPVLAATVGTLAVVVGAVVWVRARLRAAQGELRRSAELLQVREEEARATRERLRALVEASPAAIFELDCFDRVRLWNKAAERVFGWRGREVIGGPLPIVDEGSEDEHRQLLVHAGELGVAASELAYRRKDGERVRVAVSVAPVEDGAGEPSGLVGVALDVGERKLLEEELRQAQKMETVGRLAGGLAHDFNNILLAIRSEAWLLASSLEPDAEKMQLARAIERATERGASLARQVLGFSRRQLPQPVLVDLGAAIAGMAEMLEHLVGEHVELVTRLEPSCFVQAEPGQIEQVTVNLVVNARDAMVKGGALTVAARAVEAGDSRPEGVDSSCVLLEVSDTGDGIGPEQRARIFEPFFTTKREGSGLGLATVHGIVAQLGGCVEVASELGRGSTFSVFLPRVAGAERPEEEPSPDEARARGSETILLVEDDEMVREPIRTILAGEGYRVLVATSGAHALAIALRHGEPIDLLITDVVMPRLSGLEVARALIGARPGLRVLYVSGHPERVRGLAGFPGSPAVGAVAVLSKPFAPETLLRTIRELLDSGAGSAEQAPRAASTG